MHSTFRPLIGLLLLFVAQSVRGDDSRYAFWVWNRAEPLTSSEFSALKAGGVKRLYWQAGELDLNGKVFVLRQTAGHIFDTTTAEHTESHPDIIPVVRVSTAIRSPENFSGEALGAALRPVVDAAPGRELQIDFDCPDRLLPLYAERLRVARQVADIRRLTITALAGWATAPDATRLWTQVNAIYPMLYDMKADLVPTPGDLSPCHPGRLLDTEELAVRLRDWQRCPVAWYVGLPIFARVTLYDPAGHSRGHLRSWDWTDLVFNRALILDRPPGGGTTVLRATQATRVGQNAVVAGSYLAVRTAERAAIRAEIAQAEAAGAKGVVLFRLPDPPSPLRPTGAGWSLSQVLALLPSATSTATPAPHLKFHRAGDGTERWILSNDSEQDLPIRLDESGRGYSMELELPSGEPGWREALPGDFYRVIGHAFAVPPESKPMPVAIPLAQRLTFWFAGLPAHAALTTGLVQLAPGIDSTAVRFRVPVPDSPDSSSWQASD